MDRKELRKLNNKLINAQARLERAVLAKRTAEIEVGHLRTLRDEAINKIAEDQTSPKYDVYIAASGTNKIQVIKAVRTLRMEAGMEYGLKEAKDVVDFAGQPGKSTFYKGVTFDLAQKARKLISEAGGVAECRSAS